MQMGTQAALDRGGREWKASKFVRDYWPLALALHPLLRFLILAGSPWEMNGVQLAERFLWFSGWLVEIAIVLAAMGDGFRVMPYLRRMPPLARVLAAIWAAGVVVATAEASYLNDAVRSAFEWLLHGVFAMAVWHLIARDPARFAVAFDRFARIAPAITATVGLLVVVSVYRIGVSSDYPFITGLPGFAHIRHTGYIFAPAIALCLGRIATSARANWSAIALLSVNVALCLWLGSRGPFFGVLCGLGVVFILFAEFRRPAFVVRSGAATLIGAALSVIVPSPDSPAFNAIRRPSGRSINS